MKAILYAILWTIILLLFPVSSGTIAAINHLKQEHIFLLQGVFMAVSTIIPMIYIIVKKEKFSTYGLTMPKKGSARKILYYLPLVLIILPKVVLGVSFQSAEYLCSLLTFSLPVGCAEELYFRGIIYRIIKKRFQSNVQIILITAVIFGVGHGASIIGTGDLLVTILQILNAFFFGVVAAETVILTESIYPAIAVHFLYDFANHIATVSGRQEIVCIAVQVVITIFTGILYARKCAPRVDIEI